MRLFIYTHYLHAQGLVSHLYIATNPSHCMQDYFIIVLLEINDKGMQQSRFCEQLKIHHFPSFSSKRVDTGILNLISR